MAEVTPITVSSWFSRGWNTYKANPQKLIAGALIISVSSIIPSFVPLLSFLFSILIAPPLMVGWCFLCLRLVRNENATISDIFAGFSHFGRAWLTYIFFGLIVCAGMLLLVIPGIIWSLKYSFALFAVMDRSLSPREALRLSGRITAGHKLRLLAAAVGVVLMSLIGMPFAFGLQQIGTEPGNLLLAVGIVPYLLGVLVISPWLVASWASAYDSLLVRWEESTTDRQVAS